MALAAPGDIQVFPIFRKEPTLGWTINPYVNKSLFGILQNLAHFGLYLAHFGSHAG